MLFAVACCRQLCARQLNEDGIRQGIEVAERYADGLTNQIELYECDLPEQVRAGELSDAVDSLKTLLYYLIEDRRNGVMDILANRAIDAYPDHSAGQAAQCAVIRCILANPYRPVTTNPSWLTSTVVSLATGIYEDRAFDRMPILADALQDAGCSNDDILNHCLGDGPHVRGCWVIDLLLGKE